MVRRERVHLRSKAFYARALKIYGAPGLRGFFRQVAEDTPESYYALFPFGKAVKGRF